MHISIDIQTKTQRLKEFMDVSMSQFVHLWVTAVWNIFKCLCVYSPFIELACVRWDIGSLCLLFRFI